MFCDVAITQFEQVVLMPWDLLRDVVDGGTYAEYGAYFAAHLVPRLTDPDELVSAEHDDDEDDDDRGGGRQRRWRRGVARRVVMGKGGQRDVRERVEERRDPQAGRPPRPLRPPRGRRGQVLQIGG